MSNHTLVEGTLGVSRKRKDCELSDSPRALKQLAKAEPAEPAEPGAAKENNLLLAGFLAHEFLTKGTLFGKQWESGRSGRAKGPVDMNRTEPEGRPSAAAAAAAAGSSYAEASYLVMRGGAHIAGVVNPKQLARWLRS